MEEENRDAMSTEQSSRSAKRRAKVWEYVDTELVDGKEKAVCKFCKTHFSSVAGQGTTHLNRHIASYCREIPPEDRERFLATMKTKPNDGDQHKEMINYCQPSFRIVGRQSVRGDCLLLYEEENLILVDKIAKQKSHVSLTADLWSSNQNLGYLGVTAHFIDEEFELQKKIIPFKQVSYPHNSFAVQDGITSCLLEWELIDKIFTLTLDNASVNNRAMSDMRDALGSQMFFRGEHFHVRCGAHVLNNMVQSGLKVIPNAVGRIRDIIKVVISTPSRLQSFNAIVQTLGLKAKSGLVLDVPHHWNSTFDMLHEALKYKAALNRFAAEHFMSAPLDDDWAKAEALHGFLQEFSEATKAFSADRHPTAHLFLKMVLAIRVILLDEEWNSNELLNEIADAMHAKFQKYWAQPNIVLLIAAVLDPTQKMDFIKFYLYTIGENAEVKMRELKQYMRRYYLEYEKVVRVEFAFEQFASQNSSARTERSELDAYLEDPRVPKKADESVNVLAWWKKNADAYPTLSLMARDFLAIPVSTETLEALVCAKDWLIGFNDEEEGTFSYKKMFDSEDSDDE
ncbi:hypothetical protein BS78_05G168500 [Paspalum vaginatum]|nr:hypothetical protein BS78_05G168500 [Paspalum vaginatum]